MVEIIIVVHFGTGSRKVFFCSVLVSVLAKVLFFLVFISALVQ